MADELLIPVESQGDDPSGSPEAVIEHSSDKATAIRIKDTGEDAAGAEQPTQEKLLAGKFKNADELAKAYKELESKLGAPKAPPVEKPAESPKETPTPSALPQIKPQEPPKPADKPAPLDFNAFASEFMDKGELSAESLKKIEDSGIPKAVVDRYIAGAQAEAREIRAAVAAPFGGEQGLTQALQWAATGLDAGEQSAINELFQSGDVGKAKLASRMLHAAYAEAVGSEPALVRGAEVRAAGVKPFGSMDEYVRALSDPRYADDDKAYHAEIEARLRVSKLMDTRSM